MQSSLPQREPQLAISGQSTSPLIGLIDRNLAGQSWINPEKRASLRRSNLRPSVSAGASMRFVIFMEMQSHPITKP